MTRKQLGTIPAAGLVFALVFGVRFFRLNGL